MTRATIIAAAAALAGSSMLAGQAAADTRASANSRLGTSPASARGRDMPGLAVDPTNPLHVVAADNDLLNGQCSFHVSFDGGSTWASGNLTAPARFPAKPCQNNPFDSGGYSQTNGSIAFGSGQNVYTTFSSTPGPPQRPENDICGPTSTSQCIGGEGDSLLVAKSTDGGRTFGRAVVAVQGPADSQPYYIRPKLAVVPRASGDQVYVGGWGVLIPSVPNHGGAQGGQGLRRAITTVSNDGGLTFSTPVIASLPAPNGNPIYGEQVRETSTPVAAPDGRAWFAWRNRDTPQPAVPASPALPNPLIVARTTDGGATWIRSAVLPDLGVPTTTDAGAPISQSGGHPELARDPGNGNLYVVFQRATTYPNPVTSAAPNSLANDQDIYLARSTDNGVTWSTPLRVNDDPVGAQLQGAGIPQTQPFVTVAPNGRVDVVWHDRRLGYPGNALVSGGTVHGSAARRSSDIFMASSTNGGVSFSPNRRLTDRTMNLDLGLEGRAGGSTWYGPGAATAGNDLMVALPDSREGNFDNENSDIYLTKVAMQATDLLPVRHLTEATQGGGSVGLSRLAYPGGAEGQSNDSVTKAILVNDNDPGLALAASVLARDSWSPLLTSPAAGLPADVKAEVSRLKPVGAFVIGGTGALSATVETDLAAAGVFAGSPEVPATPGPPPRPLQPARPTSIKRLSGADAADTARAIADVLDTRTTSQKSANSPAAFPAVVIVNPASPDAAAAAGLAASRRLPVLFVDQNGVPAATAAALAATPAGCDLTVAAPTCRAGLAITKTFVVGGTAAVSDSVLASLPAPTRLTGADLQRTSEATAAEARTQGSPGNVVYTADAARPVDAAVLGAAVARLGGLMLLTPGAGSAYHASLQRLGLNGITDRIVVQLPLGAGNGYRTVASDGGIFAFGNEAFLGSTGGTPLNSPVVGMAKTPTGNGYWNVAADGGIFAFGDAAFFGSTGGTPLAKPVVGMASTPTGKGYWLVASDGGIFAFGDATFFGSTGGTRLNKPVVGMASTPTGKGYWLVASDGGIFSYGDAAFKGSTGNVALAKPVVGMSSTPSGNGYWLVASDGGIFSYGDATFRGSTGGTPLAKPIVGLSPSPTGAGYRLVASDGGIFSFGDAGFFGSTGGIPLAKPIVGLSS